MDLKAYEELESDFDQIVMNPMIHRDYYLLMHSYAVALYWDEMYDSLYLDYGGE